MKEREQKMNHDFNKYIVREYEKLDSELEQREFVEKMRFLLMVDILKE
jgi:hypothetical protein